MLYTVGILMVCTFYLYHFWTDMQIRLGQVAMETHKKWPQKVPIFSKNGPEKSGPKYSTKISVLTWVLYFKSGVPQYYYIKDWGDFRYFVSFQLPANKMYAELG